jgi:hypothetical protein
MVESSTLPLSSAANGRLCETKFTGSSGKEGDAARLLVQQRRRRRSRAQGPFQSITLALYASFTTPQFHALRQEPHEHVTERGHLTIRL